MEGCSPIQERDVSSVAVHCEYLHWSAALCPGSEVLQPSEKMLEYCKRATVHAFVKT